MFALGNSLFACGVRSAHKRSFEEASGEMDVGRRRLPPPLAPEPAHWRRGHAPPVRKPNPNLNQRPSRALFCLKLGNSSCYARYICGNNCSVVVKLVQEYRCFFIHFTFVLRKQFAANDMLLREANNYKRAQCIVSGLVCGCGGYMLPR